MSKSDKDKDAIIHKNSNKKITKILIDWALKLNPGVHHMKENR